MYDRQTVADSPSTVEMIEQDLAKPGRMDPWYRIAAPPKPAPGASFAQREAYRRGKLISIALLVQMLIIVLLSFTIGIFVNRSLLPNYAVMMVLLTVAVFLNRRGNVIIAGALSVVGLDLSLMGTLLSYPVISPFLLPLLDLLVLPELFAVSLLPPIAVFVDAFIHILFVIAALTLLPQNAELHALLRTAALQDALARPIVLQLLVAIITYLWVTRATQAIERADRATSIAMLEREMAEQGTELAEEKHQLEEAMQRIVTVHTRVANGDYSARVFLNDISFSKRYAVWEIAGSLNNLLTRLQRFRQEAMALQKTNTAIANFIQARNQAHNHLISWCSTGTAVDILVQQHNTFIQSESMIQRKHTRPFGDEPPLP